MKKSIIKISALIILTAFSLDACLWGLATLPASQNPVVKRKICAALARTNVRYAESEDAVRLLEANHASCLLLSSGNYLVSKEVAGDDVRLLRGIVHEDIEAIMQILMREERYKYQAIKELVLKHLPPTDEHIRGYFPHGEKGFSVDMYVNHIIARTFEWLVLMNSGIIFEDEVTGSDIKLLETMLPIVYANKHNYFTREFWDDHARDERIREALRNGMRFYQVANTNDANGQREVGEKTPRVFDTEYDTQGGVKQEIREKKGHPAYAFEHMPEGTFTLREYCEDTEVPLSTARSDFNVLEELGLVTIDRGRGRCPNEIISTVEEGTRPAIVKVLKSYKTRRDISEIRADIDNLKILDVDYFRRKEVMEPGFEAELQDFIYGLNTGLQNAARIYLRVYPMECELVCDVVRRIVNAKFGDRIETNVIRGKFIGQEEDNHTWLILRDNISGKKYYLSFTDGQFVDYPDGDRVLVTQIGRADPGLKTHSGYFEWYVANNLDFVTFKEITDPEFVARELKMIPEPDQEAASEDMRELLAKAETTETPAYKRLVAGVFETLVDQTRKNTPKEIITLILKTLVPVLKTLRVPLEDIEMPVKAVIPPLKTLNSIKCVLDKYEIDAGEFEKEECPAR